ncbi:hypothetical protein RugamoR57_50730 [Duganella caerulea]
MRQRTLACNRALVYPPAAPNLLLEWIAYFKEDRPMNTRAHTTPEPDMPPPQPEKDPPPDNMPLPDHAPIEEPQPKQPPVKT